jgi:hypothetical protein
MKNEEFAIATPIIHRHSFCYYVFYVYWKNSD